MSNQYTMTSGEVAELCGITAVTVKNYVENGYVTPVRDVVTNGRDGGRLFSPAQVFAMSYAQQYKTAYGPGDGLVSPLMDYLSKVSMSDVAKHVHNGENVLLMFPVETKAGVDMFSWWNLDYLIENVRDQSKANKMRIQALNTEHSYSKVMLAYAAKYPELKTSPIEAPATAEDATVELLKNARRTVNSRRRSR